MIDKNDFELRLRETLQTRELAAQSGFHFSELSQDQIDALDESINSIVSELSDFVFPFVESLAETEAALTWSAVYYPRLYHCAKYSKRLRIQVKNIARIVKLYKKEKN